MLEIANLTKKRIDKKLFEKIYKIVLKGEKAKGDISLVFVDSRKMKSLNLFWRKRNSCTDVLSFSNISDKILGEIFICQDYVKKISKDYKKESVRAFIHGILHLLGKEHNTKKQTEEIISIENKYIKKLWPKTL
ncbi:MAG: rRNA maturation RNase YbeY [Candidatus Pacebacteria bacterium]|nr:rRNA maturation RNase YbeY [Candidatus Paceibacterota bacterium]MDD5621398.1 rRNA maturation RNase YbeY [Candidatus Paceibacterota bacterium]